MSQIDSARTTSGIRRLPELDAVRGIASLTVVFLHFHEMWAPSDASTLPRWERTASLVLKPLYAGSEAVILFFVLSGLVLSLPFLHSRGQSYPTYLLRRILRIYVPYLAALALALVGATIWHGHPYHGEWAAVHWSRPISLRLIVQHLAFLGVYDWRQYDFVIWSLIQEMRISIVFPFLFLLVRRLGNVPSIFCAIALSCTAAVVVPASPDLSAAYSLGISAHYIACFIVGILLASNLDRLAAWWKGKSCGVHFALAAGSLIAYTYGPVLGLRILSALLRSHVATLNKILIVGNWITMLGVIGLLLLSLNSAPVRGMMNLQPPQFLGRISYSLYLIHPTVLYALTFSIGGRLSPWLQFPIYVTLSILVAWAFYSVVERTAIQWSRSVGRRMTRR